MGTHRMRPLLRRAGPWPIALVLAAGYALASAALVAAAPLSFVDGEEMHNATVAHELLTGSGRFLLQFQYRPNCGGCTFVSLAAAAVFGLFGVTFMAFKAVPIAFGAAIVALGAVLLQRISGRLASVAFTVLVLGAPVFLQHIMLMAWGTLFEVMAFVLAQAVLASHAITRSREGKPPAVTLYGAWGLVAGVGLWFCYTSAFALPTLLALVLLVNRRVEVWRGLVPAACGLALGAAPLLVFAVVTGGSPFEITTQALSEEAHAGPLTKLGEVTLVSFARNLYHVGVDLVFQRFSVVSLALLWCAAAAGGAVALVVERRDRPEALIPVALLAAAMMSYLVTGFRVDPFDRGGPLPTIALRYLFPASILLILTAAQGLGALRAKGVAGALAAIGLTAIIAVPGLHCRIANTRPSPAGTCHATPQDISPFDYAWFQTNRLGALDEDLLFAHPPEDWLSRVNHRRVLGARWAQQVHSGRPEAMPALLQQLRSLPGVEPRDVPAILHGLALALPARDTLDDDHRQGQIDNVIALLEVASPEERDALAAGVWSSGSLLTEPLQWPLPDTPAEADAAVGWPISSADCALCPAAGFEFGWLPDLVGQDALRHLFPQGSRGLPSDTSLRLAVIEGRAAALGRKHGPCEAWFDTLVEDLVDEEQAAFQRGFEMGRARAWSVEVEPGMPPARVP